MANILSKMSRGVPNFLPLETYCKRCFESLVLFNWNTKVAIITCNNGACPCYRTPVGELKVKERSGEER